MEPILLFAEGTLINYCFKFELKFKVLHAVPLLRLYYCISFIIHFIPAVDTLVAWRSSTALLRLTLLA